VPDVAARNHACEGCHLEIANEWRASLHRESHSDPSYQRAFAVEPLAFCTGCHAPEADPNDPGPSRAHAIGVGCVSCHSIRDDHPRAASQVPKDEGCARCHEFSFPGTQERMQLTVTEHRASSWAAVRCASCHMPQVGASEHRHASHRFPASRDAAMIKSAVRVTVARDGAKVRFSFERGQAGHAFPTGDLFRRLRLVVDLRGPGEPRHVESFLGRKTKRPEVRADEHAVNLADDRPFARGVPGSTELDVGDPSRPLVWRAIYERVEHPMSSDERDAVTSGSIEVASGSID
jgi:hypothetical protein